MKETKTDIIQDENGRVNMLASRIEALITEARSKVASFVNTAKTLTTGQQIGSSLYERLALSRTLPARQKSLAKKITGMD